MLNQIHMLYDEENGTSIIELVLKSMGNIKQDPEAMFIEDKLIEMKYREHIESFCPLFKIRRGHLIWTLDLILRKKKKK